ncbi:NDR1/HIN1-like protein 13 [Hordeum vulgare subsp. vulgare]|uniref:NDR1/HIN1-like protein 13 n=1 Tax=Hordeum vulgare subsp. vulgare TaxID=112509 RepID=UPI001D1A5679|nr:NDR1/HIN1-like protein 13 [Hordeum vulgare subsp. vulgare]
MYGFLSQEKKLTDGFCRTSRRFCKKAPEVYRNQPAVLPEAGARLPTRVQKQRARGSGRRCELRSRAPVWRGGQGSSDPHGGAGRGRRSAASRAGRGGAGRGRGGGRRGAGGGPLRRGRGGQRGPGDAAPGCRGEGPPRGGGGAAPAPRSPGRRRGDQRGREDAAPGRRAKRRAGCSCLRARLYLAVALLSLAAAVGAVYLAFKPRQPAYSVVSLVVSGLAGVGNASAPGAISPGFVATVRADNSANGKVGVHYDGAGSRVAVLYEGVSLADGAWPAFYQAPGNVTVFVVRAKGAGIRFSERERGQMAAAERLKSVMFDVDITVPVRLQLGGVRTWALPVTVRCAMAVDRLAASAKVVSRSCDVKVSFLFWRN